jgi:hypothetical protein
MLVSDRTTIPRGLLGIAFGFPRVSVTVLVSFQLPCSGTHSNGGNFAPLQGLMPPLFV